MDKIPSIDVFIGLIFVVGCAYALLLRREKAVATLAGTYISLVITNTFGQTIYEFFNGNKVVANQIWIRSNASLSTVLVATFLLGIIFISGAISANIRRSDSSAIEVIVISALNIALVVSSIAGFVPSELKETYINGSRIAKIIVSQSTFFLVIPPIALIVLGFFSKKN